MPITLDGLSHLVEVEPDHAPEADHREETLPVGATDGDHTDFQDGGEFRNGQPAGLHISPFMTHAVARADPNEIGLPVEVALFCS